MKNILLAAALLFSTSFSFGQEDQEKLEQEGLKVTYAFNDLKGKRAEQGPQELCLVLTNTNDYPVKVSFTLAFFDSGLVNEESNEMKFCIDPGKSVKGKKNALCWLITEENHSKIKEETFDWKLNDLTVEKTNSCK